MMDPQVNSNDQKMLFSALFKDFSVLFSPYSFCHWGPISNLYAKNTVLFEISPLKVVSNETNGGVN